MAIGDIKLREGASLAAGVAPRVRPDAFGAGIARAVGGLANAFDDAAAARDQIETTLAARTEKQERFKAEEAYQRWVGEENRAQAERIRSAEPDGSGITNYSNTELETSRDNFLASLPVHLREEYRARTAGYVENQITSAFNFEYQQGNEFFRTTTQKTIDMSAANILAGEISAEEAMDHIGRLIGESDLPEAEKIELTDQAEQFLAQATFQKEMEFAANLKGTVRSSDEDDVVAAGLRPYERGMLNAISARESGGRYNVRYDGTATGAEFDDFSKHPGIMVERPDGRMSSAAGRYMFTLTTWNEIAAELGLKDFSPESQDRAAIHLARKIYNRQLGAGEATFDQVLLSGNRDLIISMKQSLTDEQGGWEAFRHMSDDEFANIILGSRGVAGGGTGSAELPDIWNDPRFDVLSFDDKNRLANLGIAQSNAITEETKKARLAAETQRREEMFLAASQGSYSLEDEAELLKEGLLKTEKDVARFRKVVNAAATTDKATKRVISALATGGLITTEDNAGLNKLIGDTGIDLVRGMSPEYAAQMVIPLAGQAGFVPSGVGREFNAMLLGNNPEARRYATEVLTQIHANDPKALGRSSGISKEAVSQVMLANALRPWYTAEEVNQRLEDLRDPKLGSQVATMRKDAAKYFDEKISDHDLIEKFESWLPLDEPYLPLDASQQVVFRNDMKQLFIEGFVIAGSKDGALDYARDMAAQRWGVSTIGGENRIMKDSPERFYPSIEGSHEWIDFSVREEFGLNQGEIYQLVPDAQTLMEGQRYAAAEDTTGMNNASYQIAVKHPDGSIEIMLREDGMPERFAPEIGAEIRNNIDRAAVYNNLKRRRDAIISMTSAGAMPPPGAAEELQELQEQMREIEGATPGGDPERIIPETPISVLKERLERRKRRAEVEREYIERGMGVVALPALEADIERLKKMITEREANAKN